jgi:hypothetical protein
VKTGGNQRNRLVEFSGYVGIGEGGVEDSKSVPVGLPLRQNEPPVHIDSRTQQSEPIGDKNRITCMALKRAGCAVLGEDNSEVDGYGG